MSENAVPRGRKSTRGHLQEQAKALAAAEQEWEQLALTLVSCVQMVTPADIDAHTQRSGFLPAFAGVMHQARFLGRFEEFLNEYPPPWDPPAPPLAAKRLFLRRSMTSSDSACSPPYRLTLSFRHGRVGKPMHHTPSLFPPFFQSPFQTSHHVPSRLSGRPGATIT